MSLDNRPSQAVVTKNSTEVVEDEGTAGAAITPGMLVERDVNGEVVPHGSPAMPAHEFADLNTFAPSKGLEDATEIGMRVDTGHPTAGVETQALLADGESVDPETFLVSDGAGGVRAYDAAGGDDAAGIVARATETVNNTSGGYVRVNMEWI